MKRQSLLILALLALIAIAGCTTTNPYPIKTNTTIFHNLPAQGNGEVFDFLPNEEQRGSIEYTSYAQMISSNLQAYGWVQFEDTNSPPAYLIFFDYMIDDGQTVTEDIPIYGRTSGGTSYHSGNYYGSGGSGYYSGTSYTTPTYGQVGSIQNTVRLYNRVLEVKIVDVEKSSTNNPVMICEGRVKSVGASEDISMILPTLVKAFFTDFPAKSGETRYRGLKLVQ